MKGSLLIVEDDPIMGESLLDRFGLEGYEAAWVKTAEAALTHLAAHPVGLVISDLRLPGMNGRELLRQIYAQPASQNRVLPPVILITGGGSVNDAVAALKEGASDYITKPFDLNRLVEKVDSLCLSQSPEGLNCPPLGVSPAMRQLEQMLPRIASHARTVLLTGESGVGKECVARRIHLLGEVGKTAPFVALNCAALPESLFEGELFGHEKGAYTGADRRKQGLLETANGGTLFLDEIGELGLGMQAKLLRVVQEREFLRVGGTQPVHFDTRIIFATNRDLRQEVERGAFREDLFYRINVIQIRIPPLRERSEDIPWLAQSFVTELSRTLVGGRKALDETAMQALSHYRWPGNVRELRHVIERACILTTTPVIRPQDLWETLPVASISTSNPARLHPEPESYDLNHYLQSCEREFINEALQAHKGQMTNTAQALGISRKALWDKIKRLAIREG
ncbi:sigma-54-dependent transcriptional regulator [Thiothrix winogradskyi]|uniref:Sigma-54 dependent transcriptional regulator n=1 Tax=Thiothrix winogradskyi TaxID=96472 RepID=A0ABY3T382_9GAMM|nr:sigma-54 dependent transcriptional regulator [Thiothrix winogradskyi]UJS26317.1 sigma-54 dependent transcriptional regulator [Thiothrix winogradskyi]